MNNAIYAFLGIALTFLGAFGGVFYQKRRDRKKDGEEEINGAKEEERRLVRIENKVGVIAETVKGLTAFETRISTLEADNKDNKQEISKLREEVKLVYKTDKDVAVIQTTLSNLDRGMARVEGMLFKALGIKND